MPKSAFLGSSGKFFTRTIPNSTLYFNKIATNLIKNNAKVRGCPIFVDPYQVANISWSCSCNIFL